MKNIAICLLLLVNACSMKNEDSVAKSDVIFPKISSKNSTEFDIPLSLKIPDKPLDLNETKESCDKKKGRFVSLSIIGDASKNLCLSMKSTESASSFVRYATDFIATAWAGFVGKNGKKDFSAIVELGSYCSETNVAACIDIYLGEGSYDKSKMNRVVSARPKILEDGTVEILVRQYLDKPFIEKIIKDNVNGVKLTDSFKNVIAGMAVNIIQMNIPNKLEIRVDDFKRLSEEKFSVKADLYLPNEWLGRKKGDFKIPFL